MEITTKKRADNYSSEEIEMLVEGIEKHRTILFGKFSRSVSSQTKREKWEKIAESVSSVSSTKRSREQIKKKWKDFSSNIKKKESKRRSDMKMTGGGKGPADQTPLEEKVCDIIGNVTIEGIPAGVDSAEMTAGDTACNNDDGPQEEASTLTQPQEPVPSGPEGKNTKKRKTESSQDFDQKFLRIEEERLEVERGILHTLQELVNTQKELLEIKKLNAMQVATSLMN